MQGLACPVGERDQEQGTVGSLQRACKQDRIMIRSASFRKSLRETETGGKKTSEGTGVGEMGDHLPDGSCHMILIEAETDAIAGEGEK